METEEEEEEEVMCPILNTAINPISSSSKPTVRNDGQCVVLTIHNLLLYR